MAEIKRHELIPSSDTTAVKKQKTNVHVCSFNNTTRLPCSSESCPINQDDKKKRMMNIYSHCCTPCDADGCFVRQHNVHIGNYRSDIKIVPCEKGEFNKKSFSNVYQSWYGRNPEVVQKGNAISNPSGVPGRLDVTFSSPMHNTAATNRFNLLYSIPMDVKTSYLYCTQLISLAQDQVVVYKSHIKQCLSFINVSDPSSLPVAVSVVGQLMIASNDPKGEVMQVKTSLIMHLAHLLCRILHPIRGHVATQIQTIQALEEKEDQAKKSSTQSPSS